MVRIENKSLKIATSFKEKLQKSLKLKKLVLFGSRAKGTFNEESDFDFIVVSNDFEEIPFYKRSSKVYSSWVEEIALEPICLTEKEFELKKKNLWGITAEALNIGITI